MAYKGPRPGWRHKEEDALDLLLSRPPGNAATFAPIPESRALVKAAPKGLLKRALGLGRGLLPGVGWALTALTVADLLKDKRDEAFRSPEAEANRFLNAFGEAETLSALAGLEGEANLVRGAANRAQVHSTVGGRVVGAVQRQLQGGLDELIGTERAVLESVSKRSVPSLAELYAMRGAL